MYPLGNVQYLGITGDAGTPVAGAFAGFGTYSLFGNWQASSALVGKGYVWSTLSDANKKAFIANPENNCYLDGDKVIQVRYRMRVVQGGGDSWGNIDPNINTTGTGAAMKYGSLYVLAKGKQSTEDDMKQSLAAGSDFFYSGNAQFGYKSINGVFDAVETTGAIPSTVLAYEGKCYALPIALVHRRNQGAYHPVYNANGSSRFKDINTANYTQPWYTTVSYIPNSISDTFVYKNSSDGTVLTGYIGTTSGRPDGLFYDQVHEGDILDLRNSSQKVEDYNRLIDREFNKAVAGTTRGSQGELYSEVKTQTTTGTIATVEVNDGTKYKSGDVIYIYDITTSTVKGRFIVISVSTNTLTVNTTMSKSANTYLISGGQTTRTKSNTMTVTDVIGNPANYPSSMKNNESAIIALHTAEDGVSMLPTGTTGSDGLATYKVSKKANATPLQVLKSTDSGATWTALTVTTHYTFSTTTNAITFTVGNIPLVAHLIMVTYQTHTTMATPVVNSEVLAIGDVVKASYYDSAYGGALVQLTGKIPTLATASAPILPSTKVSDYSIVPLTKVLTLDTTSWAVKPSHNNINLLASATPAVKVFPYLTRSNGKAYLNLVFKEMKYGSYVAPTVVTAASATYTQYSNYKVNITGASLNGMIIEWVGTTATTDIDWSLYNFAPDGKTIYLISSGAVYANAVIYDGDSWGDDSKFNIVDNVSTTTDLNGQTVLIGQKTIQLPYFISTGE